MADPFLVVLLYFLNVPFFTVPVRLAGVDGINYAGRVEVFYQGKWGKICRDEWDINDVKVVCKQLGFQSAVAEFIGMNTTDETISVAMSNVACTGQELVLQSCKRSDGKHNCVDNIGAQALCEPSKLTIKMSYCSECALCNTPLWSVHYIAMLTGISLPRALRALNDQTNEL